MIWGLIAAHIVIGFLFSAFMLAHEEIIKEKTVDADEMFPYVMIGIAWELVAIFFLVIWLWRLPYNIFKRILEKHKS